jgi:hypothetical protein
MTFGEQSPMGLLWSFMGASAAYTAFTGLAEITAALLLTMRRTALLGSLVAAGVMTNVVMLNFCYDVPVKLYSSHLLLMALFIAAPHAKRLADFFIFNRATAPAELPRLFPESWTRVAVPVFRTAVVLWFVTLTVYQSWDSYESRFLYTPKSPFYGLWNVDEFVVDGQPRPPLVTDASRWRFVTFDYSSVSVRQMDDARLRFVNRINGKKKEMTMMRQLPKSTMVLTYAQPQRSTLVLQGLLDGKPMRATLRRIEAPKFLLTTRGFHWINEYPMNR